MSSRGKQKSSKKTEKTAAHKNGKDTKSKKPFFTIFSVAILAIIVVAFIGSPIIGRMTESGRLIFGSYDGDEIEIYAGSYMSRQVEFIAEQMKAQQQESDNLQWQAYQVWRAAFERTAIHTAVLNIADDAGVHVSDRRIDLELTKSGPYVVDGVFSEERYKAASVAERSSTRDLYSEEIRSQQVRNDILGELKHAAGEVDFLNDTLKTERNFKIVEFTPEDFPIENVIAFGQENSSIFREIRLSRITIKSDEADANSVYGQLITNPGMFEELASTQSKDAFAEKGGEMGWRSYYSLEPDFQYGEDLDSLFALEKDEISGVIETTFGWTIYRCDEEARLPDLEDEETLDTVASYIEMYEGGLIEDHLIEQAKEFKNEALTSDFETTAFEWNKSFTVTEYFPVNYSGMFFFKPVKAVGEDNQSFFQKAVYSESFFETAFSIDTEEISEPVIIDDTIAVLEMINERTVPEEDLENNQYFYQYIVQQMQDRDFNNYILDSEKFEDNFDAIFYENIMPK